MDFSYTVPASPPRAKNGQPPNKKKRAAPEDDPVFQPFGASEMNGASAAGPSGFASSSAPPAMGLGSNPPPSPPVSLLTHDCMARLGQKALSDLSALVKFMESADPQGLQNSQLKIALGLVARFTHSLESSKPSASTNVYAVPSPSSAPISMPASPLSESRVSQHQGVQMTFSHPATPRGGFASPPTSPVPSAASPLVAPAASGTYRPGVGHQLGAPVNYPLALSPQQQQLNHMQPAPTLSHHAQMSATLSLDYFVLLQTLGTGTFGKVRLCRQKNTGKFFCLKILSKEKIVRLKQTEHVKSEKAVLARISHPFIVKLFATFQDSTNLYFLLEYVSGGELFSCIRRAGRLSNNTARFYAAEIVLAIRYLHSLNVAHRDLKPENLLLDHDGHIKLSDFGFAKHIADKTWTMCGTPEYIAPEVILSKGHDKAVDWWSLGVLVYEMLVGRPPFYGEHTFEIFEKILSRKIEFPSYIHPYAKDIIEKLLVIDTTKRLGTNRCGGVDEVMRHPWFEGLDWDALYRRQLRAPINPGITGEGDTHNFARYSDQNINNPTAVKKEFEDTDVFKDF